MKAVARLETTQTQLTALNEARELLTTSFNEAVLKNDAKAMDRLFAEIERLESNAHRLELQIEPLTQAANEEATAAILEQEKADAAAADKIREGLISQLDVLAKLAEEFNAALENHTMPDDINQWYQLAQKAPDANKQPIVFLSYEKIMYLRAALQKVQAVPTFFSNRIVLLNNRF